MKTRKINWKKIGVITYDKFQMTDESVRELNYAYSCMYAAQWNGDTKRAAYIRRRMENQKNYTMR